MSNQICSTIKWKSWLDGTNLVQVVLSGKDRPTDKQWLQLGFLLYHRSSKKQFHVGWHQDLNLKPRYYFGRHGRQKLFSWVCSCIQKNMNLTSIWLWKIKFAFNMLVGNRRYDLEDDISIVLHLGRLLWDFCQRHCKELCHYLLESISAKIQPTLHISIDWERKILVS